MIDVFLHLLIAPFSIEIIISLYSKKMSSADMTLSGVSLGVQNKFVFADSNPVLCRQAIEKAELK